MKIHRLQDAKIQEKRVLFRVDFNVTLHGNTIEDDTRIVKTLPTFKYLLQQKAKIIVVSHLGRPEGKVVKSLKMDIVAKHLSKVLKKPVKKMTSCIGSEVAKTVKAMKPGEIIFLENIRFYPEEEKNSRPFSKKLAALADLYVSDSFATAHRAHASTAGIAEYLPAYAGLLMQKEIEALSGLLEKKKSPLTIIVGGAKIDTKIGVIGNFIGKADYFLIGGGLANTFLAAAGFNVGKSLCEKEKKQIAQDIMLKVDSSRENFVLPEDAVVADDLSLKKLDKVIQEKEKVLAKNDFDRAGKLKQEELTLAPPIPVEDVEGAMKILDIGPRTIKKFVSIIKKSKVVVWNGPVGYFEHRSFRKGTVAIAKAIKATKGLKSIIGGGDTIDALYHVGFKEKDFTHVSTGGGAMLEFLEGIMLPGIKVLLKEKSRI
jgi:phosphoglycerate kinase